MGDAALRHAEQIRLSLRSVEEGWAAAGHGDCGGALVTQVRGDGIVVNWRCSCLSDGLTLVL